MSQLCHLQPKDQNKFEKHAWAHLINSLSGFKSANLLGSVSQEKVENLSVISSAFHLGASPPLMGFILRPHSEASPRHSLLNIKESGYFSFNHINENILKAAHQTSARYSREQSEFQMCGLTPEYKDGFSSPYVKESQVQIGLKLVEVSLISQNDTNLVIAEIQHFYAPLSCLQTDGYLDLEAAGTLCVSGLDSYHQTERISRLSYAKPDRSLTELSIDGQSKPK